MHWAWHNECGHWMFINLYRSSNSSFFCLILTETFMWRRFHLWLTKLILPSMDSVYLEGAPDWTTASFFLSFIPSFLHLLLLIIFMFNGISNCSLIRIKKDITSMWKWRCVLQKTKVPMNCKLLNRFSRELKVFFTTR